MMKITHTKLEFKLYFLCNEYSLNELISSYLHKHFLFFNRSGMETATIWPLDTVEKI